MRKKRKPKSERQRLFDALDQAWRNVVKKNGYCEYCGKTTYLNAHHIFSRSNMSVRWDLDNGICLCSGHHTLNTFSAHKAPLEFGEWLIDKRGQEWYEDLKQKSKQTVKWDIESMKEQLRSLK